MSDRELAELEFHATIRRILYGVTSNLPLAFRAGRLQNNNSGNLLLGPVMPTCSSSRRLDKPS
eukprot:3123515-Amphidinium_carterae.1